jgi:hypothetical protein
MLKRGVEAKEAKKKLKAAGENLRVALGETSDEWRAARKKRGTRNG